MINTTLSKLSIYLFWYRCWLWPEFPIPAILQVIKQLWAHFPFCLLCHRCSTMPTLRGRRATRRRWPRTLRWRASNRTRPFRATSTTGGSESSAMPWRRSAPRRPLMKVRVVGLGGQGIWGSDPFCVGSGSDLFCVGSRVDQMALLNLPGGVVGWCPQYSEMSRLLWKSVTAILASAKMVCKTLPENTLLPWVAPVCCHWYSYGEVAQISHRKESPRLGKEASRSEKKKWILRVMQWGPVLRPPKNLVEVVVKDGWSLTRGS